MIDVLYTSPGMIRDGKIPDERKRIPALTEAWTIPAIAIETGGTRETGRTLYKRSTRPLPVQKGKLFGHR